MTNPFNHCFLSIEERAIIPRVSFDSPIRVTGSLSASSPDAAEVVVMALPAVVSAADVVPTAAGTPTVPRI